MAEQELHNLVSRANARAGRVLRRRHVREKDRLQARDLVVAYLLWLNKNCDHRHAPSTGVRQCPDCGAVMIDGKPGSGDF